MVPIDISRKDLEFGRISMELFVFVVDPKCVHDRGFDQNRFMKLVCMPNMYTVE
jgi:hypothetical protein